MTQTFDVLLVEDDRALAQMVSDYLQPHGFNVNCLYRGDVAPSRIIEQSPAAVILDVNLPGLDGFEVCCKVREDYRGTIIILTARGEESDEVRGLEVGADDFMAKPVRPRALLARLRAHLRRNQTEIDPGANAQEVIVGDLTINASRRECKINDTLVNLTTAEFDLLWLLAKNHGQTLSRGDMYLQLNGYKYDGHDRSIDLRVSRLRKRLGDDPHHPQRIKSVRGVGYLLVAINS